ncbi:MAG: efflux RND transporter periplasmic adaptor subunit [Alphaproteobacteria bacterium]|nr:efflux RND transporter periplasmic adaptor subunit [Alphaproteobacteria bacterium]
MADAGTGAFQTSDIQQTLGVGRGKTPWWRRWWMIAGAIVIAAIAAWWSLTPKQKTEYIYGKAEMQTVRAIVTATGTLAPLEQVTVGAEVSGRIESVLVDFNDHVTKGQIIAHINTDSLKAIALQARAAVAQAQANLQKAENDLKRAISLQKSGFVSTSAYDTAKAARDTAAATLKSAKAQSEQAEANLSKADIRSPIDGIVLDRKVDPGQTVAASFQTPELFVIASDLTKLELDVDIDEADIGQVRVGQSATFTVDAYPAASFSAKVRELRNAARTVSNVVTYQGVLSVDNSQGLLKPGMTATADITTKVVENVLTIPNGALRFTPDAQTYAGPGAVNPIAPVDPIATGKGKVWTVGADGKPVSRDITLGASDGRRTQVTSSNVKAGDQFILDVAPQKTS